MQEQPTWKVHYFNGFGRAEAIRMLLTHAKVNFENVNYGEGANNWAEAKASGKFEFGQLPAIEGNGKIYAQSGAILRYLGIRYGYYPVHDPELAWRVDSTLDSQEDMVQAYYNAAFAPTEEAKAEGFKNFFGTTLPNWFKVIEHRIEANQPHKYIVGDKITTADFALGSWAHSTYLNEASANKDKVAEAIKGFPKADAYFRGLHSDLEGRLSTRTSSPW
jgi:glutathione S-transferase